MSFYYNALDLYSKSIRGAVSQKDNLILKVKGDIDSCRLHLIFDSNASVTIFDMEKCNDGYKLLLNNLPCGLYFYFFDINNDLYYCDSDFNIVKDSGYNKNYFQLTIYSSDYKTPDFLKGGVIYQIFPDRFNKGEIKVNLEEDKVYKNWNEDVTYKPNEFGKILNNDFFGGNFKGIEEKLDYLKELNVNLIYLNPISLAYSNHRYDTSDYFKIDPLLGSLDDFKSLINKAHEKGIKIMLDGVYNHTGDDSLYFNKYAKFDSVGAYQNKNSPYYSWYEFSSYPNEYKCWWDIDILPSINKNSLSFQDYISQKGGVIDYFMSLGVDGFRLDVVDELSSPFVKKIREAIKSVNSDGVVLGEVWEDATNKIAYGERRSYFQGKELDSVMNYPLKDGIINYLLTSNSKELKNVILTQINNYPKDSLDVLMNILGTHDTPRILTVLSGVELPKTRDEMANFQLNSNELDLAYKRLTLAVVLLFTLYGVPSVYYGDERGMQGCKDPFNRRTINWKIESSILGFYKKISSIRASEKVFKNGETNILIAKGGLLVFERVINADKVIVAVNLNETQYDIKSETGLIDLYTLEQKKKFTIKKDGWLILKPL